MEVQSKTFQRYDVGSDFHLAHHPSAVLYRVGGSKGTAAKLDDRGSTFGSGSRLAGLLSQTQSARSSSHVQHVCG